MHVQIQRNKVQDYDTNQINISDIERWLQFGQCGIPTSRRHKSIVVDNYEATIFPAESAHHTHKIDSMLSQNSSEKLAKFHPEFGGTDGYYTWFLDLNGGKTEYVITIATMIGKSRMKGQKV